MPFQVSNLALETLGIGNIITVHAREIFPAAYRNRLIQAGHTTDVRVVGEHKNTRIGKTSRYL